MNIRIKRVHKELPLPAKGSPRAAAFDITAREDTEIPARGIGYVPLNIVVETPEDHFLLLAARSSTHKKGLIMANGIGIIDPDFSGDEDEIKAVYYNMTDASVHIVRGDRIAQGMFVRRSDFEWHETDMMGNATRGGFGSTGV